MSGHRRRDGSDTIRCAHCSCFIIASALLARQGHHEHRNPWAYDRTW